MDWKQEFDQKFTPNSIYPEEVKVWIEKLISSIESAARADERSKILSEWRERYSQDGVIMEEESLPYDFNKFLEEIQYEASTFVRRITGHKTLPKDVEKLFKLMNKKINVRSCRNGL